MVGPSQPLDIDFSLNEEDLVNLAQDQDHGKGDRSRKSSPQSADPSYSTRKKRKKTFVVWNY